jgi:hypothetical protein
MTPREGLWLCFFRGLNVFGRGIISMFELESRCRASFEETGRPIQFVDYFGATGNVAVLATGVAAQDIREALSRAIPKPAALVEPRVVAEIGQAFSNWPAPPNVPGFQWTPGVSMVCEGDPAAGDPSASDLGIFKRVTPSIAAIYRRERVTERGTLHADRNGGWAAVSSRTEAVLGGVWTARSFEVMRSLLAQARWRLASADTTNA